MVVRLVLSTKNCPSFHLKGNTIGLKLKYLSYGLGISLANS